MDHDETVLFGGPHQAVPDLAQLAVVVALRGRRAVEDRGDVCVADVAAGVPARALSWNVGATLAILRNTYHETRHRSTSRVSVIAAD